MRPCTAALALVVLPSFAPVVRAAKNRAPAKPNVLFIAIDDLRDWAMKGFSLGSIAVWLVAAGVVVQALPAEAAADAPPVIAVWEMPQGAGPQVDVAARRGWKQLDPDRAQPGPMPGGAIVENGRLTVVLPAGGDAIVVRAPGNGPGVRLELALLDSAGRAAGGLGNLRLGAYDGVEAALDFAMGAAEGRLKLGAGSVFVEIRPGKNAAALQVRAPARFSFLPDFFGNDVLYDPQQTADAQLHVPAENFLVHLLEGGAALAMLVWPQGGGEDAVLLTQGEGPQRRIGASRVSFNGKSVFLALVARQGIWCSLDLRSARKDATFAVEGWTPPFPARWMTILARRPAVDALSGIAAETLPIRQLPPEGADPYSDVYVHPRVPSWFTGPQWRLHLQTSLTHMMTREKVRMPEYLLAVNYPRDRVKETPLDVMTLVDVMRGTLGAGPCEYVLDLERLNKTRSTGAAGTGKPTAAATCSERGALVYYYLGERAETPRRDDPLIDADEALSSVEKIKDFLDAAHARIQEYLAWSDEIISLAERAAAADPGARQLAERIVPIARQMRQLWDKMVAHEKPCAYPREWQLALDHCKDLIRQRAPDLGWRIREFDPQMRGAGEEVDGGMQACRMIVKRIRQEAALAGSSDAAAIALASTIRRRCREILGNKHYKEGDNVQLSGSRGGP